MTITHIIYFIKPGCPWVYRQQTFCRLVHSEDILNHNYSHISVYTKKKERTKNITMKLLNSVHSLHGGSVLTESASRLLLASPTVRMALSTSRCPGRQFTHRFRAWDTALATYTHTHTKKYTQRHTHTRKLITWVSCLFVHWFSQCTEMISRLNIPNRNVHVKCTWLSLHIQND